MLGPARVILLVAVCAALALPLVSANGVSGCGGFVGASSQLKGKGQNIDYSTVKVNLYNAEGLRKAWTECAPSGYYFIPLYEHGTFTVQVEGPEGWAFEPAEAQVVVSEDGKCNNDADVNFAFTGFSISGQVEGTSSSTCTSKTSGLGGVSVMLTSGASTISTVSDQSGRFSFNNVFPGTYTIKATHPKWSFVNDEMTATLQWGSLELPNAFVASGYDLSGAVEASGEAMAGVSVFLYSSDTLNCEKPAGTTPDGPAPSCMTNTGADGSFSFQGIPCGQYTLRPLYRGESVAFDVSPSSLSVDVGHGSLALEKPFQVTGFAIRGRVVDTKGNGVASAKVSVDGSEKATSDSNGFYTVSSVTSGSYSITAKKANTVFEELGDVKVVPTLGSLPDIKVSKYSVCGMLSLHQAKASGRQVSLSGAGVDLTATTTATGDFCFEVVPGYKYVVKPVVSASEKSSGLLLAPEEHSFTLDGPLLDLQFSQSLLSVKGRVRCLEGSCSGVTVSLVGADGTRAATQKTELDSEDLFTFNNVLPGSYNAVISHSKWCWEKNEVPVKVNTESVSGVEFAQSGFSVKVVLSHSAELEVVSASGKSQSHSLAKGPNSFCVAAPGVYTATPSSCFEFEQKTYRLDTSATQDAMISAAKVRVVGKMTTSGVSSDKPVVVKATGKSGEQTVEAAKVGNSYSYELFAAIGDKLELAPSSKEMLFYPPTHSVVVSGSACPESLPEFVARSGLYIKGSVFPQVAGVGITAYFENTETVVSETTTGVDGKYSVGPLYDDKKYTVVASKPGYDIARVAGSATDFEIKKLASIAVSVVGENSDKLGEVLLSLSGEGYRSNQLTDASGFYEFLSLTPGSYYLRPMLKEYVFEPNTISVELGGGETKSLQVSARRVAFSAFGRAVTVTGEPEKLAQVQAVGPKGEYEEAQADAEGNFRIRGLEPGKKYAVSVRSTEANRIERAVPDSVPVQVVDGDVRGLEFIAFRRLSKFEISGVVDAPKEHLSTLKVVLSEASKPDTPLKTVALGPTRFFQFPGVSRDSDYVVTLSTSLSPKQFVYELPTVEVSSANASEPIELEFSAVSGDGTQDIASSPFALLLALVAIVVGSAYRSSISDALGSKKTEVRAADDKISVRARGVTRKGMRSFKA